MPSPNRKVVRASAAGALGAALVAVLVVVLSAGGGGSHRLSTVVPEARYMIPGLELRAAGQIVGRVAESKPTPDGKARLELQIDDDRVWPVPRGTTFRLRWNGSITYTGRYVELELPARATAGHFPENAVIPSSDVVTRVEADDLFRTFDRESRRDLKATLDAGGAALGPADDDLRLALDHAPPAVEEARAVLEDLGADERALDTLVRSSDRVVHAVRASDRGIGPLIEDASTTFTALAAEAEDMRRALSDAPGTLASARRTLGHADRTLRTTGDLATRLAPGVTQVRRAIPPLTSVLQTVQDVGPDARVTLRTARRAAPDLNELFTRARDLMPTIESVSGEAAEQLACLRPYAPEIAGLATTWSRFLLFEDNQDKHARSNFPAFPFNQTRSSSADVARQFPYLRYGFPQPPGFNAGQPWFIPECSLGPDTVDVNRDPEIGRSEPTR